MGLKEWIIPQDKIFYDKFEEAAANAEDCAKALLELFQNYTNLAEKRQRIKDLEHKGDSITHAIFDMLGSTFILPLDREDISHLAKSMDDIADFVYAASNRLFLYEIKTPTPEMVRFTQILLQQIAQLRGALTKLRSSSTLRKALEHNIEVHRLENEADRLLNEAVATLFRAGDPIHILKHKEIYEMLETATDKCEDVADVISDIVRKQG
jgi:uncharacterized protein